jgi:hypothetical protein
MTLEQVLAELYKHEINCLIYSEWDAGWTIKLGDEMNGYSAAWYIGRVDTSEIGNWLIKMVNEQMPSVKLFEEVKEVKA